MNAAEEKLQGRYDPNKSTRLRQWMWGGITTKIKYGSGLPVFRHFSLHIFIQLVEISRHRGWLKRYPKCRFYQHLLIFIFPYIHIFTCPVFSKDVDMLSLCDWPDFLQIELGCCFFAWQQLVSHPSKLRNHWGLTTLCVEVGATENVLHKLLSLLKPWK